MRKIAEGLRKVDHYGNEVETIRFLLGDVAGQSVFYDIHSIMLRLQSLFILVVDLERPLDAKAEPLFLDKTTGKKIPIENYLVETNLDYAKRWMAALDDVSQCHGNTVKVGPEFEYTLPATILVLTKSDKLQGSSDEKEKKIQEVKTTLINNFKSAGVHSHIAATYVIDNTKSSDDRESEDDQIQKLRAKIFETAEKILKAQEETPINWLKFERALSTVIESEKQPYITLEKARELAEVCEVDDKFSDAMKSFHEENIVVRFEGDQPESDLVVLDPSWLVKLFTEVITVPPPGDCSGNRHAVWNNLVEKGQLDLTWLPAALEKHWVQKETLIKMMERACLICHWKGNLYLVPSMVKSKITIDERFSSFLQSSIYIAFLSGYIPLGFYLRIQTKCLEWCRGGSDDSEMPELHSNFSRFAVTGNSGRHSIILVRRISRIQVGIKGMRTLVFVSFCFGFFR